MLDRPWRLTLLTAFLALALWRLIRFVKLVSARRPVGIAGGAGMLVPQTGRSASDG
jgi:hypothetical protein